ncbi:MAG TPA: alkaline phosphatase family protein, partial [Gemmatirosa sp.]|nr:alkaline phosphatase family protein [Gemmatirosa sp.]
RPDVLVVTMTVYDATLDALGVRAAFPPQSMARIVAEVLTDAGHAMLKTAETEKYPHVTYFYNGGNETPYAGEERILVPSQQVATYDLAPEMSARGVTDVLVNAITTRSHAFMLCNLANGDMVGHSGSLPATIQACQVVDECLARVMRAAEQAGARLIVTADHGNCEMMFDPETGGPHTAHTTNPVPLVVYDPDDDAPLRSGGALCDVGPTVLRMLGIDQPSEMTGRDLRAAATPALA